MRTFRALIIPSLALAVLLTVCPTAQANHKQEAFEKCVKRLREIQHRCVNANKATVEECKPRIRRLLEAGHVEEARRLAAACIEKIEETTKHCNRAIKRLCTSCVRELNHLGAPRLAQRFRRLCDAAIDSVNSSARRSIHAIRSCFDGTD